MKPKIALLLQHSQCPLNPCILKFANIFAKCLCDLTSFVSTSLYDTHN